jgi:hypothetical protein
MFQDRYHELFYEDKDDSVFRKQLLDLRRLNIDCKEIALKKQQSILSHTPVYNTKMDTMDHQMTNLRGRGMFESSINDKSRYFIAKSDSSQNESIQQAKNKKNEISKIFAQGIMSLEKPKYHLPFIDTNPLKWIDSEDAIKTNTTKNKKFSIHNFGENKSNFNENLRPSRNINRSHSFITKENGLNNDLTNSYYYQPNIQQSSLLNPYTNLNRSIKKQDKKAFDNKNSCQTQDTGQQFGNQEIRADNVLENPIKFQRLRERNVVTGERFEEKVRTMKNLSCSIMNNADNASKLIYQSACEDQKANQRNLVDEFIDQNYGSIYIGKKGIIAYEEEKKTQFECQKILNPFHLKQVLEDKNINPFRAESLKAAIKNRINAKSNLKRKEKLKDLLMDMSYF